MAQAGAQPMTWQDIINKSINKHGPQKLKVQVHYSPNHEI